MLLSNFILYVILFMKFQFSFLGGFCCSVADGPNINICWNAGRMLASLEASQGLAMGKDMEIPGLWYNEAGF